MSGRADSSIWNPDPLFRREEEVEVLLRLPLPLLGEASASSFARPCPAMSPPPSENDSSSKSAKDTRLFLNSSRSCVSISADGGAMRPSRSSRSSSAYVAVALTFIAELDDAELPLGPFIFEEDELAPAASMMLSFDVLWKSVSDHCPSAPLSSAFLSSMVATLDRLGKPTCGDLQVGEALGLATAFSGLVVLCADVGAGDAICAASSTPEGAEPAFSAPAPVPTGDAAVSGARAAASRSAASSPIGKRPVAWSPAGTAATATDPPLVGTRVGAPKFNIGVPGDEVEGASRFGTGPKIPRGGAWLGLCGGGLLADANTPVPASCCS
mmetsp:Transcript_6625/g.16265  ORF Transcript_6625/g.16265 Transcript_6625/m.16265 type:complete len:326 (+) Transcript_6625:1952-2929(+)